MSSKTDVLAVMREFSEEIETLAAALAEDAWKRHAYENGWQARELLSHIASTSGVAGFVLTLSRAPGGGGMGVGGGAFDVDQFNAQQVAMRQGRPVPELVNEIKGNIERDISAVLAVPDQDLARRFRAPWDVEGTLAEVIIESFRRHLGAHLGDLRAATA